MSDKAHVTNLEALDRFRSTLILFIERCSSILDEVSEEVKRTRVWLQSEQKLRLTQEMKKRHRELEMLEQELFTARLSGLKNAKTGQQMQVNKKRKQIRDLEDTMRAVAGWARNFDSTVETEARKVEKLRFNLDTDMKKAVQYLSESVRLLEEYTETSAPRPTSASTDATTAEEEGDS